MSGLLVYPSTLPSANSWEETPVERRAASQLRNPAELHRNRSRDYGATVSADWVYDATAMATWKAWYDSDLAGGLRWFSVTKIPGSTGFSATRVARYQPDSVKLTYLAPGVFRVSAQLDIRGAGLNPIIYDYKRLLGQIVLTGYTPTVLSPGYGCFYENFTSGLAVYTQDTGTSVPFSIVSSTYGSTFRSTKCSASNDNSFLKRSIIIPRYVSYFAGKFMVWSVDTDDAGIIECAQSSTLTMSFNPRREAFFDSDTRAHFNINGNDFFVSAAALNIGVWYQFEANIVAGLNNSSVTLTNLNTNATETTVLNANLSPPISDTFRLGIDDAPRLCETDYAQISICGISV